MLKLKHLLMEAEEIPVTNQAQEHLSPQDEEELKTLLGQSYEGLVAKLKQSWNDEKLRQLIASGMRDGSKGDDVIKIEEVSIAVTNLRPTQNEIGLDESLKWPIQSNQTADTCLDGKDVMLGFPKPFPIVTLNNQYVIDGHHRWSQVYAVNTKATMKANNINAPWLSPIQALKAVQMAIAIKAQGKFPSSNAKGTNMLKSTQQDIVSYCEKNAKKDAIVEFDERGKLSPDGKSFLKTASEKTQDFYDREIHKLKKVLGEYIWKNVQLMQTKNAPVSNAPARTEMPQTDKAPGYDAELEKGVINISKPLAPKNPNATNTKNKSNNTNVKQVAESIDIKNLFRKTFFELND